jgi:hypothetical protein
MVLRKWVVMPSHGIKPYEVQAEQMEVDAGCLLFWITYAEEPFLALAVGTGMWATCKQVIEGTTSGKDTLAAA